MSFRYRISYKQKRTPIAYRTQIFGFANYSRFQSSIHIKIALKVDCLC